MALALFLDLAAYLFAIFSNSNWASNLENSHIRFCRIILFKPCKIFRLLSRRIPICWLRICDPFLRDFLLKNGSLYLTPRLDHRRSILTCMSFEFWILGKQQLDRLILLILLFQKTNCQNRSLHSFYEKSTGKLFLLKLDLIGLYFHSKLCFWNLLLYSSIVPGYVVPADFWCSHTWTNFCTLSAHEYQQKEQFFCILEFFSSCLSWHKFQVMLSWLVQSIIC